MDARSFWKMAGETLLGAVIAFVLARLLYVLIGIPWAITFLLLFGYLLSCVVIPRALGSEPIGLRRVWNFVAKPIPAGILFLLARVLGGAAIGLPLFVEIPGIGWVCVYEYPGSIEFLKTLLLDVSLIGCFLLYLTGWSQVSWAKKIVQAIVYIALAVALVRGILPTASGIAGGWFGEVDSSVARFLDDSIPEKPEDRIRARVVRQNRSLEERQVLKELNKLDAQQRSGDAPIPRAELVQKLNDASLQLTNVAQTYDPLLQQYQPPQVQTPVSSVKKGWFQKAPSPEVLLIVAVALVVVWAGLSALQKRNPSPGGPH